MARRFSDRGVALKMIDKLKKIAELAPELLGYLNVHMDNLEAWLDTPDRQWMLIGRIVDDLQSLYPDTNIYISPANADEPAFFQVNGETAHTASTLLEAVCDAWLALKG